jgi:DNA-binding Lrp family transcriptional regulator
MLMYSVNMANFKLDDTDRAIIAALRQDARTPIVTLAKSLGLARATVQNRISRLEDNSVIVGYAAQLGHEVNNDAVRAVTNISIEGNHAPGVVAALSANPYVTAVYSTNGRWDMVVEISAPTLSDFDRITSELRLIDGISNSESCLLLNRFK